MRTTLLTLALFAGVIACTPEQPQPETPKRDLAAELDNLRSELSKTAEDLLQISADNANEISQAKELARQSGIVARGATAMNKLNAQRIDTTRRDFTTADANLKADIYDLTALAKNLEGYDKRLYQSIVALDGKIISALQKIADLETEIKEPYLVPGLNDLQAKNDSLFNEIERIKEKIKKCICSGADL